MEEVIKMLTLKRLTEAKEEGKINEYMDLYYESLLVRWEIIDIIDKTKDEFARKENIEIGND